jgi:hypothetical protein
MKDSLEPLAQDPQVLYYDRRGHGRGDYSSAEFWNLRTWADDPRRLCDAPLRRSAGLAATRRPPSRGAT